MYIMICTRPDLTYPISVLSGFMADPVKAHWEALKWMLRYFKGTINFGLTYGVRAADLNHIIKGFADSNYVKCIDTRKSISGYIFTCFDDIVN